MVLQTYSDKQKEEKEVTKQDHQKWSVRLATNREIGSCVPMLMAVSCLSPVRIQIFMSALDRLEMVSGTPYRTTRHINTLKQNWKIQYRYKVKFNSMHKTKMYDTYNSWGPNYNVFFQTVIGHFSLFLPPEVYPQWL